MLKAFLTVFPLIHLIYGSSFSSLVDDLGFVNKTNDGTEHGRQKRAALADCGSCGAAVAAGTCILAASSECGTDVFYLDPGFTYGTDGNGCKTVTVKCYGSEWLYSTTYLADGVTPSVSQSGDQYGDPGVVLTAMDTYTCAADGTYSPSSGQFACETLVPIVTTTTSTTNAPKTTVTTTTVPTTTTKSTATTTTTKTTTTKPTCCPPKGIWTEWTAQGHCPDYCGACGNVTYTRSCSSAGDGCPCTGAKTRVELCNVEPCYFPRLSCCPGKSPSVYSNTHACGPLPGKTIDPPAFNNCSNTCCPTKGIWSEWMNVGNIQPGGPYNNLTCGMCATQTQTRKCLSLTFGCQCMGSSAQTIRLTDALCFFPASTCCAGYVRKLNETRKVYTCQPSSPTTSTPIQSTNCCPPDGRGLWNDWGSWATCTATCGLCGTQKRTRSCASDEYGCPCIGQSIQTQKCGNPACSGSSPCCLGTTTVAYDGTKFCKPPTSSSEPSTSCKGTWQPWRTSSECSANCGMCGTQKQSRYCMPPGCACSGAFNRTVKCSPALCPTAPVCCVGSQKKLNPTTNKYTCQVV